MLSIILPVHNEYQYTRWCLFSIINRTKTPYELIIVNDYSDEKTTQLLKNFTKEYKNFKYLETPIRGWHSGSCNLGIDNSQGDYICLLNTDTIVTTGWETHMIEFLQSEKGQNVSVVGPSTSYSASHQQLPQYHQKRFTIKYHEAEPVGTEVYERYQGQSMITRVTGFCLLFDRKMLGIIGKLDEQVFPSAGNESDWMLRGLKKDLHPCWVKYSYVHHFGQASYVKAIGQEEKMERWKAADNRLIERYGKAVFDVIQNKYWRDQKVEY
jgi:GT2 family glycosyltransferase